MFFYIKEGIIMKNKKRLPQLRTVSLREVVNLQMPSECGIGVFTFHQKDIKVITHH